MTRRVTPGEPILPHMTAKWFNKTLQDPQQKPLPPGKEERKHNETKATFIPTELCAKALRFTAVAPVGRVDTYGNRVERAQYVDKGSLNKYNWIITQLEMAEGYLTQDCVYAGITFAKVNILNPNHKYVDLNLDTLELESSTRGKGVLLDVGSEYSLISIETFVGTVTSPTTTTQPLTPIEPQCDGECKYAATSELTWTLEEEDCAAPTTSTTSTSTTTSGAGTTTTYDGYSLCVGTTSTTTTADECDCLFPAFCPTDSSDITFTACSTGRNSEPPCVSTTTSTTTSCDCDTTTTGDGGCNCDLVEVTLPDGTIVIQQIGNCPPGCECKPNGNPTLFCEPNCENGGARCVCPEPPGPCQECNREATLFCGPIDCDGTLGWWYDANECGQDFFACSNRSGCFPAFPPGTCTNCLDTITVPCISIPYTTTSPEPPTCCNGECQHCYGCPSTTTSSTSTTTTNDCTLPCTRKWNGSSWDITTSNCNSPCYCGNAPFDGRVVNEVIQVPCFTPPTTTTSTTTSTSTTTTPPRGACCSDLTTPGECFGNLTAADCSSLYSGVWLGVGTNCDPNPCATTTTSTSTTTTSAPVDRYCCSGSPGCESGGTINEVPFGDPSPCEPETTTCCKLEPEQDCTDCVGGTSTTTTGEPITSSEDLTTTS